MVFIFLSIGMYELTNQRRIPAMIRTMRTVSIDIILNLEVHSKLILFIRRSITKLSKRITSFTHF
jgi:hypothetical protein